MKGVAPSCRGGQSERGFARVLVGLLEHRDVLTFASFSHRRAEWCSSSPTRKEGCT
jgi:hypothetical protein